MVNQKRLPSEDGFYDPDTSVEDLRLNHSNGFLPPSPPESPHKLDSKHAAFDAGEETLSMLKSRKKRKATPSSYAPDSKRVWRKDDELVILKGIVDYQNETGVEYLSDSVAFFDYIKDDIASKVSKDQLMNKMRKLKSKFRDNLRKKLCFTNSIDSETFDLSMAIWGKDKAQCVGGNMDKAKVTKSKVRAFVEHEAVTNGELENDDGSAKSNSFDKLSSENVDKNMENETGGKESEEVEGSGNDDGSAKGVCFDKLPSENVDKDMEKETGGKESEEVEAVTNVEAGNDDGSAKGDSCGKLTYENIDKPMEKENEEDDAGDELCALQDALETTMFQHLGDYAQKLMLQKLRSLRAKERKELSDEWKSLLFEEVLLKSKKHSFSAKLAKAALHD